jgi:hypothetical protein
MQAFVGSARDRPGIEINSAHVNPGAGQPQHAVEKLGCVTLSANIALGDQRLSNQPA